LAIRKGGESEKVLYFVVVEREGRNGKKRSRRRDPISKFLGPRVLGKMQGHSFRVVETDGKEERGGALAALEGKRKPCWSSG